MVGEAGQMIAFNGEVYNYRVLRSRFTLVHDSPDSGR